MAQRLRPAGVIFQFSYILSNSSFSINPYKWQFILKLLPIFGFYHCLPCRHHLAAEFRQ